MSDHNSLGLQNQENFQQSSSVIKIFFSYDKRL